jgi:hypothetical protein
MGESVVSNLVLSKTLKVINNSGNFSITDNGFTGTNGTNTFVLNPNDAQIFKIMKGTNNVIWMDSSGNANFSGIVTGSSFIGGSIQSSNYASNTTGMYIDLSSGSINSKNFRIDPLGNITVNGTINAYNGTLGNLTVTGTLTGGEIYGSTITGSVFRASNTDYIMELNRMLMLNTQVYFQ